MRYVMKKRSVERIADTETAKANLEKLGYAVVKIIGGKKATESEEEKAESNETVEVKNKTKSKKKDADVEE